MQAKTRTAVLVLAGAIVAAGCGPKASGPAGTSTEFDPPTGNPTVAATTSTTSGNGTLGSEPVIAEPTEPVAETSTTVAPAATPSPDVAVDEIDSLLAGLDETLAELDQLLNQAAAALAAEEGEILP